MNTKRGFTPVVLLLIVALVLIGMVGYYLSFKRRLQVDLVWKEYSSDNCGTSNPKTKFSISIPKNWDSSLQEDKIWTKHTLSGTNSERLIVLCGIGFGGACPPEALKEIRLGNDNTTGCYIEDEKAVRISQIGAISDNGIGVSIEADFPNNEASKEVINQILSTFKFLD